MVSLPEETEQINWARALTLAESHKLSLVNSYNANPPHQSAVNILHRWKGQSPFNDADLFRRRLDSDGFDERSLLSAICLIHRTFIGSKRMPPLLRRCERLLARSTSSRQIDIYKNSDDPFLILVDPFIANAGSRLKARIARLTKSNTTLPFDCDQVVPTFLPYLEKCLTQYIHKTCILELNVARLEKRLSGKTSKARYEAFIHLLAQPGYKFKFFSEYTCLLRQIAQCTEQWITTSYELLKRVTADYDLLQSHFSVSGNALGKLIGVESMVGDRHRKGKSVAILEFESGRQIVYKPRSTKVDLRFQDLLLWCNRYLRGPHLRTITILDRNGYGWAEFVEHGECENQNEIERFYCRQGSLLALAHVLNISDLHHENIIASGENPVLVDLETLFHPACNSKSSKHADLPTHLVVPSTVTATGLLPTLAWSNKKRAGVDISGLGGSEGQELPKPVFHSRGKGTDKMSIGAFTGYTQEARHRPRLSNEEVDVCKYQEQIRSGFRDMYRALLNHRYELLAVDGPIEAFRSAELRYVLRPTMLYSTLLSDGFHPDNCRVSTYRNRYWDRLWLTIQHRPFLERIVKHEVIDLENGNIPYFSGCFENRSLATSNGTIIKNFFLQSPEQAVRSHIAHMSEKDLETSLWTIDATFRMWMAKGQRNYKRRLSMNPPKRTSCNDPAFRNSLLTEARRIGNRLSDLSVNVDERAFWVCPVIGPSRVVITFLHGVNSFYDGQLGIALFLAYLGSILHENKFIEITYRALEPLRRGMAAHQPILLGCGVFEGYAGYVFVLMQIGRLFNDKSLLNEADIALAKLESEILKDEEPSIIGGAAGCILALESVYQLDPNDLILQIIGSCADRIFETAVSQVVGVGWPVEENNVPLTGFSHGAAGYVAALITASSLLGKNQYHELALEALRYEQSQFFAEYKNWPDYRKVGLLKEAQENESAKQDFSIAWCHGASGIGIGRLRALRHVEDPVLQACLVRDVKVAVKTTLKAGFSQRNYSLCHGDLGNLDFLLQAANELEDHALRKRVYMISSELLSTMQQDGWTCGLRSERRHACYQEAPGLMVGLSGIGWELIRLAEPSAVPSVLSLDAFQLNGCIGST